MLRVTWDLASNQVEFTYSPAQYDRSYSAGYGAGFGVGFGAGLDAGESAVFARETRLEDAKLTTPAT